MLNSCFIQQILEQALQPEPYLILDGPPFIQSAAKNLYKFLSYVKVFKTSDGYGVNAGDTYIVGYKRAHTIPGHETATGIEVYYNTRENVLQFSEITSKRSGMGTKMVEAIISELPKDWLIQIHHDWSGGFWKSMKRRFSEWTWNLENSFSSSEGEYVYRLFGDREEGVIKLQVIKIVGEPERRQYEIPFRTPEEFFEVENKVEKEVEESGEYQITSWWKEVRFEPIY
jgi:hypothetical protein